MKLARFRTGRVVRYGVVEEGVVAEIRGSIFGRFERTNVRHKLEDVRLLAPVQPSQMFGPGLNFAAHLGGAPGLPQRTELPQHPDPWHKAISAIIGPNDAIITPKDSTRGVDYEGECLAVVGRRCRRVSPEAAWDYILGYTCGNDISERNWQREDRSFWRAKGSDTFAPIGPWIETVLDPRSPDIVMAVRVNGKLVQEAHTKDMLYDFGKIVSWLSQQVTLKPGDIVWSGTTGTTEAMRPGDVVEVEITKIGVLRNPVDIEK